MFKVEKTSRYKTFYWASNNDVYDTVREDLVKFKIFGVTLFTRQRKWYADYFENDRKIGFKNINSENH